MKNLVPHLLLLPAVLCFTLTGCAGIGASLMFNDCLLVKVPGDHTEMLRQAKGWDFQHVLEGPSEPVGEPPLVQKYPLGNWYMAWRDKRSTNPHVSMPWSRWVFAREHSLEVLDASKIAFGVYPTMIEPDLIFAGTGEDGSSDPSQLPAGNQQPDKDGYYHLTINEGPSAAWPNPQDPHHGISVAWHMSDAYSQLSTAIGRVEKHGGSPHVCIGILDNGYSSLQKLLGKSPQIDDEPAANAIDYLLPNYHATTSAPDASAPSSVEKRGTKTPPPVSPGMTGGTHGTGTLGILAGAKVRIYDKKGVLRYQGYLGAAPHANIVPVKIAPWVFSLTTANLAYGIDYASRVKKCDVISMSHGGAPSEVWADAVNAAYLRGTAMFAAESDFYSILPEPFQPHGFLIPPTPVYPASFRRVMGVAGVTSEGTSYGVNSLWRLLAHPLDVADWVARGSFGPKGSSLAIFGETEKPDPTVVACDGILRAYPVSGYSPNIPWLYAPRKGSAYTERNDLVDLNGAGTSAATPQVAGAATLWLQFHHKEWESLPPEQMWKKVEAVYDALLISSYVNATHQNGTYKTMKWPNLYLGAGPLRANAALDLSMSQIEAYAKAHQDLIKFAFCKHDFADGARSLGSLYGLTADTPVSERADLNEYLAPQATREDALTRMLYNTNLLEKWHDGGLPRGDQYVLSSHPNLRINNGMLSDAAEQARKYIESVRN